jgi:hypothetical protein
VTERITDYLVADHGRLHILLGLACAGETVDAAAFAAFRAGLLRHIAIEEKILFPAVQAAHGNEPLPRFRALHEAHSAIARLLVVRPDLDLCSELAYVLGRHDAQEEGRDGVYAECEHVLGPSASQDAARRARAYGEIRVAAYRERRA